MITRYFFILQTIVGGIFSNLNADSLSRHWREANPHFGRVVCEARHLVDEGCEWRSRPCQSPETFPKSRSAIAACDYIRQLGATEEQVRWMLDCVMERLNKDNFCTCSSTLQILNNTYFEQILDKMGDDPTFLRALDADDYKPLAKLIRLVANSLPHELEAIIQNCSPQGIIDKAKSSHWQLKADLPGFPQAANAGSGLSPGSPEPRTPTVTAAAAIVVRRVATSPRRAGLGGGKPSRSATIAARSIYKRRVQRNSLAGAAKGKVVSVSSARSLPHTPQKGLGALARQESHALELMTPRSDATTPGIAPKVK